MTPHQTRRLLWLWETARRIAGFLPVVMAGTDPNFCNRRNWGPSPKFPAGVDAMLKLLLSASLMLFAAGAAAALVFARKSDLCRRMTHGLALCGTVLILVVGIAGLSGNSFELLLPQILPLAGGLALGLDRLSAFFL